MHFYHIPLLKFPQNNTNQKSSSLNKSENLVNHSLTSIFQKTIYGCFERSLNTFLIWMIDMENGNLSQKLVRLKFDKIVKYFVYENVLIIQNGQGEIYHIEIQSIFKISKLQSILLEKNDILQKPTKINGAKYLFALRLMDKQLIICLNNNAIHFNEVGCPFKNSLIIKSSQIGNRREDNILTFTICDFLNVNKEYSDQLIIMVVLKQKENEIVYVFVQVLLKQNRYFSFQIYREKQDLNDIIPNFKICALGKRFFAIITGKRIVICQREEDSMQVFGVLYINQEIQAVVGIQNRYSINTVVILCKKKQRRIIYSYDIQALLNYLRFQPTIIQTDSQLSGSFYNLIKIQKDIAILIFQNGIHVLYDKISTLYSLITNFRDHSENQNIFSLDDQIVNTLSQSVHQYSEKFLTFGQFSNMINSSEQVEAGLEQLRIYNRLLERVSKFNKRLWILIPCLRENKYFSINVLLKEYSIVLIYLIGFLQYDKCFSKQRQLFVLDRNNLFHEINLIFNEKCKGQCWFEQNEFAFNMNKNIIIWLKNNIDSMQLLFKKLENKNGYAYHQIIENISISKMIQFLFDHTSLIDYLIFHLYKAGLEGNKSDHLLIKTLLTDLLSQRKDYPPMMSLITKDISRYSINRHHLKAYKNLQMRQSEEQNSYPLQYKQNFGEDLMLSFVPKELKHIKFDGDFLVISIPTSQQRFIQKLQEETITVNGVLYLYLTEKNLLKSLQNMDQCKYEPTLIQSTCHLYNCSQKLKITNEIFINKLEKLKDQKQRIKKTKLLSVRQIYRVNQPKASQRQKNVYDFRSFSNEEYEKIHQNLRLQKYTIKFKPKKCASVIDKYVNKLADIADDYNFTKFLSLLKKEDQLKDSNKSINREQLKLKISRIERIKIKEDASDRNVNLDSFQSEDIQDIFFQNLWILYDRMIEKLYSFKEELNICNFGDIFLKIIIFLFKIIQKRYIKDINNFLRDKRKKRNIFQIINQLLDKQRRFELKINNTKDLHFQQKNIFLLMLRTVLLAQFYNKYKTWMFKFEDLIVHSSKSEVKISNTYSLLLSNLIELENY